MPSLTAMLVICAFAVLFGVGGWIAELHAFYFARKATFNQRQLS